MSEFSPQNTIQLGTDKTKALADACLSKDRLLSAARKKAFGWIIRAPFYMGVRLQKAGEVARSFWVSKGDDPSLFTDDGLVSSWSPIGRIALEVKNAIKDRRPLKPVTLKIPIWRNGPAREVVWTPCGAVADFELKAGELHADVAEATVWLPTTGRPERAMPGQVATNARLPREGKGPSTGFGLVDVVASLDTEQLRNVDFPEDGPLVVTGCAGTGKTTVAMYRVAYLLSEQREALREDRTSPVYFRLPHCLLVVRKEHLRPYLEGLAKEVGVDGLPVETFDDWFQAHVFRPYFKHGQTKFATEDSQPEEEWTAALDEDDVSAFLGAGLDSHWGDLLDAFRDLTDTASSSIDAWAMPTLLSDSRLRTVSVEQRQWSRQLVSLGGARWIKAVDPLKQLSELGALLQKIRRDIDETDLLAWRQHRPEIDGWIREATRLRSRIADRLARLDLLLRHFYGSASVKTKLAAAFGESVASQAATVLSDPKRLLNHADQATMLWLVELFTDGIGSEQQPVTPMRQYYHIIVDEAQYYSASILRLFARRCRAPRRAITIVGDLEQRFGGGQHLEHWTQIVGEQGQQRVKRLDRLYRCSKEIYSFLFALQPVLKLKSRLVPPRDVDRFSAAPPHASAFGDSQLELEGVAEQIDLIKSQNEAFSVAVIMPLESLAEGRGHKLQKLLVGRGIPARVATGEDIRESVKRVMITEPSSVVGLEFDCVVIPSVSTGWPDAPEKADTARELWVCLTRAKRSLTLTTVGSFPKWLRDSSPGGIGFA